MFDWIRKNAAPVFSVVGIAVGIVGWSHSQFAGIREEMLTIRAEIIERIDEQELAFFNKLDDSEELLIQRMLSTTDEVQEQQRITVSTLHNLYYRLGVINGIHGREANDHP